MPSLLDDDFLELPDGIVLPVQSMAELLDLESKLQDDNNFRKLVKLVLSVLPSVSHFFSTVQFYMGTEVFMLWFSSFK